MIQKIYTDLKKVRELRSLLIFFVGIPTIIFIIAAYYTIPLLQPISGAYCLFFLPGYLATKCIGTTLRAVEKICLSITLSFFLTPYLYYSSLRGGTAFDAQQVITNQTAFIAALALTYLILHILRSTKKPVQPEGVEKSHWGEYWSLYIAIGIFGLVTLGLTMLYPYLSEADPYYFLEKTRLLIESGQHPQIGYRPLFSILMALFQEGLGIPVWHAFKYILPFVPVLGILALWEFGREHKLSGWMKAAFPLLLISSPYYLLESQIVRPQVIIAAFAPVFVYFLAKSIIKRDFLLWFIIALCSIASVRFHELGLFLILPAATTFAYMMLPNLATFSRREWGLLIAVLFLVMSTVVDFITSTLVVSANFFSGFSKITPFKIWFLDNFTNIDGTVVSWKGLDAAYYYAYTLSLAMVVLFIIGVSRKSLKGLTSSFMVPAGTMIIPFLLIAEILPRFGINFLPDRAWLFATTILVFPIILFFKGAREKIGSKPLLITFIICFTISMIGSYFVTIRKKGYVSAKENIAGEFLVTNTPDNSVIITQGGNNILVQYFANRTYSGSCVPFFTRTADRKLLDTIWASAYKSETPDSLASKISEEQKDIALLENTSNFTTIEDARIQINAVSAHMSSLQALQSKFNTLPKDPAIYLLYSQDKFNNLYSQREWWREGNCQNPNFEALNDKRYFDLVYDKQNVKIWKVNMEAAY